MSQHQPACANGKCVCQVIPPHILENIAKNGNEEQRETALRTLQQDSLLRAQRITQLQTTSAKAEGETSASSALEAPRKNRLVHNAENSTLLPGTLVRKEGQNSNGDVATDEAYDGFGATFDLFWEIYQRNSIDAKGMDMSATVHYDYRYNNAFWDGTQMVFGDGDGFIFNRFTLSIDVIGHELAHGVTEHTAGLEYHDQPGALNESLSDVFGSLVKQRALGQTAEQADWLIGAGLFTSSIKGTALRSMKAPGTAYDDWLIGKDPQPDHMSKYDTTTSDNGGVHINSGIPNKAFYLAATAIGGKAWEKAGHIWYQALIDSRLSPTAQFQDFAELTVEKAGQLYGDTIQAAVAKAWKTVGINIVIPEQPTVPFTVASTKDGRWELFCIGTDKALWHTYQIAAGEGGNWSGWKSLGGEVKQFSVSQNQDGRLEVFCIGKEGAFSRIWQQAAGADNWSSWQTLGKPASGTNKGISKEKQPQVVASSSAAGLSFNQPQNLEQVKNEVAMTS
ncbi:M4 family metallopeptidase [Hymenobacter sp. YC55]|uniref:M4 family metallopeptidase n=1 Tax=Hymenobacter sp. YC55 TaxID=3034019 RepID=UPI0023F919DE|nr:M4 family metallopeptidase [Hymenobacter sp. YC55]MDF7814967.1 M4 family metallopeptidase [Hymenobacter sp. YC55]